LKNFNKPLKFPSIMSENGLSTRQDILPRAKNRINGAFQEVHTYKASIKLFIFYNHANERRK